MIAWYSLFWVLILVALAFVGVEVAGMYTVFGLVIPMIAIAVFIVGFAFRIISWARTPVPFRIPTTAGQQKSLDFIKHNSLESPYTTWDVIKRMFLEVVFFRSLFRNTKAELHKGEDIVYGSSKYLWLGSLVFHYSFLIIFLRHFKYFVEPIPFFVKSLEYVDSFFQIGLPLIFLTDIFILLALTFLIVRRFADAKMRIISLPSDYFPLFLILGIAVTGILMRYFIKVDIVSVKELAMGLLSFNPVIPEGISVMFYIHFFLVCSLLMYFPFSKLMHIGGVFLSPTRNLANNNRAKRHINPWNYPVHVHTYAEYEDEFRPLMKAAGLPLDKEEE